MIDELYKEIDRLAKEKGLSKSEVDGLLLANEDSGMSIEESLKDIVKMFNSGEIDRMKEILTKDVKDELELLLYKTKSKMKSEGKDIRYYKS